MQYVLYNTQFLKISCYTIYRMFDAIQHFFTTDRCGPKTKKAHIKNIKGGRRKTRKAGRPTAATRRGSICFPGNAKVTMETGVQKPISQIRVGDRVQTTQKNGKEVATVIFVPHELNVETHFFIELITSTGRTIRMTENHYIPIKRIDPEFLSESYKVVLCKDVCIGDRVLLEDGSTDLVAHIQENVADEGIYSFTTDKEFIAVDGFVVSSFGYDSFSHETLYWLFGLLRFTYTWNPAFNANPDLAKWVLALQSGLDYFVK